MSRVLVWITPTGWEECVDAASAFADAEVAFLQVSDEAPEPGGLLGRHRHPRPPVGADDELLDAAEGAWVGPPSGSPSTGRRSTRWSTPPRTSTC